MSSSFSHSYDYLCKLLVVGDSSVGKSCMRRCFFFYKVGMVETCAERACGWDWGIFDASFAWWWCGATSSQMESIAAQNLQIFALCFSLVHVLLPSSKPNVFFVPFAHMLIIHWGKINVFLFCCHVTLLSFCVRPLTFVMEIHEFCFLQMWDLFNFPMRCCWHVILCGLNDTPPSWSSHTTSPSSLNWWSHFHIL